MYNFVWRYQLLYQILILAKILDKKRKTKFKQVFSVSSKCWFQPPDLFKFVNKHQIRVSHARISTKQLQPEPSCKLHFYRWLTHYQVWIQIVIPVPVIVVIKIEFNSDDNSLNDTLPENYPNPDNKKFPAEVLIN